MSGFELEGPQLERSESCAERETRRHEGPRSITLVACERHRRARHGPELFGSSRRTRLTLQTSPFQSPPRERCLSEQSSRGSAEGRRCSPIEASSTPRFRGTRPSARWRAASSTRSRTATARGHGRGSRTDLGEGERVFAFHQTRFVVTAADVVPIGDCNPRTDTLSPCRDGAADLARYRDSPSRGRGRRRPRSDRDSHGDPPRAAVRSSSEVIQSRGAARSPKRVGLRPSNPRSSATQYAPRRGTRCGLHRRGDRKSGGARREPRHPLGRGCRDGRFLVWPEAGHAGCRVSSAAPRDPKQPGLDSRPPSRPLGSAAEARDDSGPSYRASSPSSPRTRSRWSAHRRRTRPLTAGTSASSTSPRAS